MIEKILCKVQCWSHSIGLGDLGNFIQDVRDKAHSSKWIKEDNKLVFWHVKDSDFK